MSKSAYPDPLDLSRLRAYPLAERKSLTRVETLLRDPSAPPPQLTPPLAQAVRACAGNIRNRPRGASVMLIYGAHLIKNGAHRIIQRLLDGGFVTHLASNGAGCIHDWELSFLGRTEESVRANVASGSFGTWDETSRNIHLAVMAGALRGEGYGQSVGRFIAEDGTTLPEPNSLSRIISETPDHHLTPARAELLQTMRKLGLTGGRIEVPHPFKKASVLAHAFNLNIPFTIHPGIGYDIISNHPVFNGAALGRAATIDFRLFAAAVERLEGGVVLSVGSAIMGPQVFEKTLSCVNNLRLNAGRAIVQGHSIYVVDIQDGGNWDWSKGEPPKDNPAYYLRFCKSYARMGGAMSYVQCDNVAFLHNLLTNLENES